MKIILIAALALPFNLLAQNNFTLNGKVGISNPPGQAFLLYRDGSEAVTDSVLLKNGEFTFKGHIAEPTLARLIVDHKGAGLWGVRATSDMTMMYLQPGVIKVSSPDSVKKAAITGTINAEYKRYRQFMADRTKEIDDIRAQYPVLAADKVKNADALKALESRLAKAGDAYRDRQFAFVRANPDSYISLVTLREAAGAVIDATSTESYFNGLSARIRESYAGREFKSLIDKKRNLAIGHTAPDFTQRDVNDNPVRLSDFKGKYVLVDFWASWCGPCRAENPTVVKAYNQYKDKGFTVLSVSLDRPGKKTDWLAAIQKDGLTWTNISDLKFWDNEVAQLYGIKSVPQNFLIDGSGKIVAVNLRGEELGKTLEKFL